MARSLELRNRNIGRIAYIPNRNMPVGGNLAQFEAPVESGLCEPTGR
jgi:hypothetical protein